MTSRNREKRSRSLSNDASNSFVKNVTSRMSGLLPATITKWFSSSSSSSNVNGSALINAEGSDSSSDDEGVDSPITQPPAKRVRLNSTNLNHLLNAEQFTPETRDNGSVVAPDPAPPDEVIDLCSDSVTEDIGTPRSYNPKSDSLSKLYQMEDSRLYPYQLFGSETRTKSTGSQTIEGGGGILSSTTKLSEITQTSLFHTNIQMPSSRNSFRKDGNFSPFHSTPKTNQKEDSDNAEISASPSSEKTCSAIGQSYALKRKAVFNNDSLNLNDSALKALNTTKDPKQPCFKPSLLGSPFYSGRTMYGGGAASYINHPNIKQQKKTLVNETNTKDNSMSHSARKVLDLLEHYSSPLMDARRIPSYVPPKRFSLNNFSDNSNDSTIKLSYRTQELHVPSIASMLRLKQKSRLMDTTNAARQIIASHSSSSPYPIVSTVPKEIDVPDSSRKFTTKMKSKVGSSKRANTNAEREADIFTPVQLPTAILEISKDNLPKFTSPFNSQLEKPRIISNEILPMKSVETFKTTQSSESNISKLETVCTNSIYKFSSPEKISIEHTKNMKTPPKYTFGSPDRNVDKSTDEIKKCNDVSVVGTNKLLGTKSNDYRCKDCWVTNKSDAEKCVCCGANNPSKLDNNINFGIKMTNAAKEWKCPDCWVSNKADTEKCACCGALNSSVLHKPKEAESKSNINASSDVKFNFGIKPLSQNSSNKLETTTVKTTENSNMFSFGINYKNSKKCNVCKLASVQPSKEKCINCENSHTNNIDSKMLPKYTWKCPDCWVDNKQTLDRCACCSANKPDQVKAIEASEWKCNECCKMNKIDVEKCAACDSMKPGLKSFKNAIKINTTENNLKAFVKSNKWECSCCLVLNDNDKTKCACCEKERPNTEPESLKPGLKSYDNAIKINTSENNLKAFVKSNKWECSCCLVQNDNDKSKCVCCEKERPNTEPEKQFNFGMKTNSTFKFGIDKAQAVNVSLSKPIESFDNKLNPEVSETNNNVLPKAPLFGLSTLPKPENKIETVNFKTPDNSKVSFSFGIPKSSTEASKPKFDLTSTNKLTDIVAPNPIRNEEKVQEVPKVDLNSSITNDQPKPLPSIFGTSGVLSLNNKVASPVSSEVAAPVNIVNEKDGPAIVPSIPDSVPKSTFALSTSAFKPTASLFGLTANSAVTAAANPSPFAKPNTTNVVRFGVDPVPTAAPAPAPAQLFSFGSTSTPKTQEQLNKSNFTFTYGSANKNEPSMFKSSFGTDTSNKFTLPTSNTMSGNTMGAVPVINSMSGNGLSNAPGLGAGNPPSLFSVPVAKENTFGTGMFASPQPAASSQPSNAFTFGSVTPFSAPNNNTPSFGAPAVPTQNQNVFDMTAQSPIQSSMFGASQPPSVFGSPTSAAGQPPSMFDTPTFGSPNNNMPAAPSPAFNFRTPLSSGSFSFGQGVAPSGPVGGGGAFSFGGSVQAPNPAAPSSVQFAMGTGTAQGMTGRRVRKAVRRTSQR